MSAGASYNQMFSGRGLRSYLHHQRFHWLCDQLERHRIRSARIIELGCFDAKTVGFLDRASVVVERYVGLDQNRENGLDEARQRLRDRPQIELHAVSHADEVRHLADDSFDIGICMETFEHLPDDVLESYLSLLARVVVGYLFVTIPVERGPLFLFKHAYKRLRGIDDYRFSRAELVDSVLGRLHRVERDEHKGFDDRLLVARIRRYFDVLEVRGLQGLPPPLSVGVGIVAQRRFARSQVVFQRPVGEVVMSAAPLPELVKAGTGQ